MKVFVTGANGYVGSHLCRLLVERGDHVRGLVRKGSVRKLLDGVPVELVEGDLLDQKALESGMDGCEQVYHTAALVRFFVRDKQEMWRTNVEGTRNVIEVARRVGVQRLVHTSTVAVLKRPRNGTSRGNISGGALDETYVADDNNIGGAYERTKLEAERLVLAAAADGLPCVICSPSGPVGPGDLKPSPVGKVIVQFLKGKIPAYTETGLNVVDVRDVAGGHILAAERGRIGERYILCGENLALAEFFQLLSEISGIRAPKIRLPYGVVLTFGLLGEIKGRLTGKEPLACLASVRTSKQPHHFTSEKARRELGFAPRPIRPSIEEEVEWFRAEGFV